MPDLPRVRTIVGPLRYAQASGAITRLGELVAPIGTAPLVVADDVAWALVADAVTRSFDAAGLRVVRVGIGRCTTAAAIDTIAASARDAGADVVVGIGGGSTIDAVKAAGHLACARWVAVPTVASTDAPCSALAAVCSADGTFEAYRVLPHNPDLVLVDTQLVANAPVRFLVAGIGDALSTWIEARAVALSGASTLAGGPPTLAATALARLSWDVLHEHALAAVAAVREHTVTRAVEKVVEANVLLSGIGFESGGLAAAHAIHNGLTAVPQTRGLAHGELVTIGSLTQLVLEQAPADEVREFVELTTRLGLPTTLTEIGLAPTDTAELTLVAEVATRPGSTIHAMPFAVSVPDVVAALCAIEPLAREIRAAAGLPAPIPHRAR